MVHRCGRSTCGLYDAKETLGAALAHDWSLAMANKIDIFIMRSEREAAKAMGQPVEEAGAEAGTKAVADSKAGAKAGTSETEQAASVERVRLVLEQRYSMLLSLFDCTHRP